MLTPGSTYKKNVENKKTNMVSVRNMICFHGGFSTSMSTFYGRVNFCKCAPIFVGYPPVNVSMWSLPKMKVDHFPTENHGKPMGF